MKQHKCEYCESAFYRRRDKEKHLLKAHNIDLLKMATPTTLHILRPPVQ